MKTKSLFVAGGILLILAALPFVRSRPAKIRWHTEVAPAINEARSNDRKVLVFLYTDWCGYCRQMDRVTFADPSVISELSEGYSWLRLNAETDPDGQRYRNQFRVGGFPTLLILGSDEQEIDRIQGFVPPDRFIRSVILSTETLGKSAKELDDPLMAFDAARKHMESNRHGQAADYFERVLQLDPSNEEGKSDASLFYLAQSQVLQRQPEAALKTLGRLQTAFVSSQYARESRLLKAEILIAKGQSEEAKVVLAQFLQDYPSHKAAPMIRDYLNQ